MKTTNEKAGILARELTPFNGSNLYGNYIKAGDRIPYFGNAQYDCFIVYSYKTAILGYVNGVWIANKRKYSRTTSKQLSQLKYYIDIDQEVMGEDNLKKEISEGALYGRLQKNLIVNNNVKQSISKV